MRASLVECVASIAEHELPEGRWQDLLPFLNQCTQAAVAEHRASSVTLFKALAESVPAFLAPHFPALQTVCMKGLRDESDLVRRASLFAVSGILGALQAGTACSTLSSVVPPHAMPVQPGATSTRPAGLAGADKTHTALLQQLMAPTIDVLEACISASISTGALDDAHNGISLLLEIIEEPLPLLVDCFPRIVRLSLTTTCSREVELELRNHASQVRVSPLCTRGHTSPYTRGHHVSILTSVFHSQHLTLLTQLAMPSSCWCPPWRCTQQGGPAPRQRHASRQQRTSWPESRQRGHIHIHLVLLVANRHAATRGAVRSDRVDGCA